MARPSTPAWMLSLVICVAVLGGGRAARAADAAAAPPPPPPGEMPAPTEATPPAPTGVHAGPAPGEPVGSLEEEGSAKPADLFYGVAARLRWVTVPAWLLNSFTAKNVPLSSWGTGIELFRRKGDFDFVLSFSYQNMSPGDGNWLGKSNLAAIDTDLVQFRGLALYGVDASFIWHNWFSRTFGIHYGAGLGVAIVAGDLLRTSNANCTDGNAGDLSQCHPLGVDCPGGVCNEAQLRATEPRGGATVDSAATPSRFADGNVPGAIPIVNIVLGVDIRIPQVPGVEIKVEGGFFDAFFMGGGVAYMY